MMRKIAFVLPPSVEILDLAGPVQVFTEAKYYGFEAELEFYRLEETVVSSSGLSFGEVRLFNAADLSANDYLFVPGMDFRYVDSSAFKAQHAFFKWLKRCSDKGTFICSVCTGAFALGYAGLLRNTECTTHWRRIEALRQAFPDAKVLADVLFKKSNNVYTSAGISAGIDLSLSILEEIRGALFTHKVARGLVVYHRRSQNHTQQSVYLDYRNHIHPNIHAVQDHLIEHLAEENPIERLADMVAMSPRNLSRVFKEKTGMTVIEYLTLLRLEQAKTMLNNPHFTMEYIASRCGFKTARQLQRILKNKSAARRHHVK
jgi:transcriptional regulator GlxA family with amidase domain